MVLKAAGDFVLVGNIKTPGVFNRATTLTGVLLSVGVNCKHAPQIGSTVVFSRCAGDEIVGTGKRLMLSQQLLATVES